MWLRLISEYSQTLSQVYEELFSAKARRQKKEITATIVDRIFQLVETWKLSIPEDFRPGLPVRPHRMGSLMTTSLAVQLHFFYYNIRVAVLRASAQSCSDDTEKITSYRQALVDCAKGIADLVHLVPLEPFVSTW